MELAGTQTPTVPAGTRPSTAPAAEPALPATPLTAASAPAPAIAAAPIAVAAPPAAPEPPALPAPAPPATAALPPAGTPAPKLPEAPTSATATKEDIAAALLDVVAQKTGYPAEMLDLAMDVEADLGIDSIKRVEIMGVLQERFPSPTPVGPEHLAELRTLSEIVGFVFSLGGTTARATAVTSAPVARVNADDVTKALLGVVAEKTGYPAEMLDLTMDVEADLGIDSIKRVEIMGVLQERFPSPTPAGPEHLAELRTLNEIVGFVLELSGPTSAATEPAPTPIPAPTAPAPAPDDVRTALLDVVAQKTGYPAEMLDLTMDVEADLGIDSIKRVEIMGVLQERFPSPTPIGPEHLAELRTLADIVGFVTGLNGTPVAEAPSSTAPVKVEAAQIVTPSLIGRGQAELVELPLPDRLVGAFPQAATALVVNDGSEVAEAVTARLVAAGWQVRSLRLPGVPERVAGVPEREAGVPERVAGVPERVAGVRELPLTGWGANELAARFQELGTEKVHLAVGFTAADELPWSEGVRRLAHQLLVARHLVAPLTAAAADGHRAAFVTVTRLDGAFGLGGVSEDAVPAGGIGGLAKTLAVEAPELFCRAVDLAPALGAAEAAELILTEIHDAAVGPVQVGHDGVRRVALTLGEGERESEVITEPASPLTPDDLLVVTGGARGITARCVEELARTHKPGLLLLGRTPLGNEPDWAHGVTAPAGLKAAAAGRLRETGEKPTPKRVEQLYRAVVGEREVRKTLAAVRAAGSEVEYLPVDITDTAATAAALAPYRERITGLVHGAGVLADQLISAKKAAEIERVFAVKLGGLRSVTAALPAERLRHVVLFSSVAGFFGNRGQSDYAMANEVLNTWAASFRRTHPKAHVSALNWGAWDSGMVSPQIKAVFEERGIALIPEETGTRLFTEQFAPERSGDVVTVLGPTTPLSAPELPVRTGPFVLERDLSDLLTDPLLADHVIGDAPVLPAAAALGWAAGAVERLTGRTVAEVRDFAVHKGVIFDGGFDGRLRLTISTTADGTTANSATADSTTANVTIVSTADDGSVRPHYAATVVLDQGTRRTPERQSALPALGGGSDARGFYDDGTLFHGESLRGLRRVLNATAANFVVECELAELPSAGQAFGTDRYTPATADLLLQAALVWMRSHFDTAALPMAVRRTELYEVLPSGEPFLVVVAPETASGTGASVTVTACAPDGRVLLRLVGVSLVSTPQLAAKFASR
nr:SDR family NAD(P)-dependent oxidoreductase [Streptomyces sp. SID13726]